MRRSAGVVTATVLLIGALFGTSACGAATTAATTEQSSTIATHSSDSAGRPTDPDGPGATSPPGSSTADLPDVHLPGVNDPSCTSAEPPVVLLHGTFSTVAGNFAALAAALQAQGRCVYGINYGLSGVRPVRESATTVAGFVDDVLAVTGAEQVDVVAFSQGGLVLRTALRLDGLAPDVGTAVLIAPTFHGSTSVLLNDLPVAACPACADQAAGSALLQRLDAGGDLDGDVDYATISSRDDTVVTPVDTQPPVGPEERVASLIIQDRCPGAAVDHLAMPGDPGVIVWVREALATGGHPTPSAYPCG